MILLLQERIIELLIWFYTLPSLFGLVFLLPGIAIFMIQFARQEKSFLPGLIAAPFIAAGILHFLDPQTAIDSLNGLLLKLQTPDSRLGEVPFVEFIFHTFVGDARYRAIYHELLFVAGTTYLILVAKYSWDQYKKTGIVLGEVSLKSLVSSERSRPQRSDSNELGSGDLATADSIASWTRAPTDPKDRGHETRLPVKDLRGSGGAVVVKTGELVIPREARNRHVLAVAKTGSGKTSRLILPVLYSDVMDPERSTIVIDSKPEMWEKLANLSRKYNPDRNILLFNALDTVRSLSWNFLSKIETDTDCKLIANTIIMATDNPSAKADSPFFKNNALAILNAMMVGLLYDENETLSMPRIHELVQSGMKPLCDWLEAHPDALRTSRTFVELARSGSQNADTIMSELGMRLAAWDLSDIRATTSQSEIDLEDLVSKPTLFIVEFRESELEMLRPLANVIVVEILRFLTKRAESCPGHCLPRPVGLVIDEFASALGRLPDIHVKLNTLRSRNVSIVAAIQSMAQVKANYGDDADSVLAGFSTKIFMPSLDIQDAEWASKETGQMTIRFQTASTGSNKKLIEVFASKNSGSQEQIQQRAVLTPDEIGRPLDNRITFFMPNTAPFQGHLIPFFKVPSVIAKFNEFKGVEPLRLRDKPIEYKEAPPPPPVSKDDKGGAAPAAGGLPAGISNTKGWTDDQILEKLKETKAKLDWDNTTGSARKWWEAFENENKHRLALVLRLGEELANRKATVTEFFLAYVYSNTDNIQANLHYLDYTRLKKEEEKRKKEAAAKAKEAGSAPSGGAQQQSTSVAA